MIVPIPVICNVCTFNHILKVSVGYQDRQSHTFRCYECDQEMGIVLNVKSLEEFGVQDLINCTLSNDTQSGIAVHLHPDLLVKQRYYSLDNPTAAVEANVREMQRLFEEFGPEFLDMSSPKKALPYDMNWKFIKQVWELYAAEKYDLCKDYIQREYEKYGLEKYDDPKEYILETTKTLMGAHGEACLAGLEETWKACNPDEREKLITFLKRHLKENELLSPNLISDFYKSLSDFTQVLTYIQLGVSMPDELSPSSFNFEQTWMFYGSAFECLAKLMIIPACLNNIRAGRKFGEFERLTLEKFLDLGAFAKKGPFEKNVLLQPICLDFDNQLRNGSHHRQMHFNARSGQIKYKQSSAASWQYISYKDYLRKCCILMQGIAAIMHFILLKTE